MAVCGDFSKILKLLPSNLVIRDFLQRGKYPGRYRFHFYRRIWRLFREVCHLSYDISIGRNRRATMDVLKWEKIMVNSSLKINKAYNSHLVPDQNSNRMSTKNPLGGGTMPPGKETTKGFRAGEKDDIKLSRNQTEHFNKSQSRILKTQWIEQIWFYSQKERDWQYYCNAFWKLTDPYFACYVFLLPVMRMVLSES